VSRRRVAIVTPWFGPECKGGAEMIALELATRLSAFDDVTVLTTTSRSFLHDWDVDYHKPGRSRDGSYAIERFRVKPRDRGEFNRVNLELLGMPPERWNEISSQSDRFETFIDESINSPDLEKHLRYKASGLYDAVLFIPYLYGVVVRGIEAYPGKAHLIPCLHDEAYARIPRIEASIHKAASLLFNSSGEAEFALRLYGPGVLRKSYVVGSGIPPRGESAGDIPIDAPFFLYIGRRAPEKGVDDLLTIFKRYRTNGNASRTNLVLIGPGEQSYDDPSAGVRDLGFVDEPMKLALLARAVALVNPSHNESYSRVLMEAWREETPVVAHAACLATSMAVRESKGGFVAGTPAEWLDALHALDTMTPALRRALAAQGTEYAAEHADWDRAISRLRSAIGIDAPSAAPRNGKRIDQVLEGFDDGDAISDYARHIRRRLQGLGYESNIYAVNLPSWIEDGKLLAPGSLANADAVVYHHSIGSRALDNVLASSGRKAIIYHNITPPECFEPYAPAIAQQLAHGREQLAALTTKFDIFIADSDYNARELHDLGAPAVRTISVVNDFRNLDCSPKNLRSSFDRATTWLFVGRVVPNKAFHALIDAFEAYLALEDDARLLVVGKYGLSDPYYIDLKKTLEERRLDPYVYFTGFAHEPHLVAAYQSADVFVCLSEHEGFCVPLVEAMFFDLPIVAKALAAVPGTLGNAGLLLEPDADACDVAAAVHEVCTNDDLRSQIIASQRARRIDFLPERIVPLIDQLAADLTQASA
jgi:glycosyltransferase involved in cell wall biosynthesis